VLAASDPANLLGTIVQGAKVPRVAGSRVLYRDGVPIATSVAGEFEALVTLDAAQAQAARRALTLDTSTRFLALAASEG
jgi:ATP-dependent Lhr-like helicase